MNTLKLLSVIAALLGAAALNAPAQTKPGKSTVALEQTKTMKATVEEVDHDTRMITLKGPKGNSIEFKVGEEVRNFPQIRKGDEVKVAYRESIAFSLRKPGEPISPGTRNEGVATRPPGQKPGGVAGSTTQVTATVEDVDRKNREVTLKGPRGNVLTVKVDPSIGNLERIHKGDQIEVVYTEALAVSVDKPGATE